MLYVPCVQRVLMVVVMQMGPVQMLTVQYVQVQPVHVLAVKRMQVRQVVVMLAMHHV